ncbi:MAG: ATP-binding domain-containing protein, partial [Actinomycetota bacterium]|nr:ATP-binding domain-containing protein [Actinomycetota bacterium]
RANFRSVSEIVDLANAAAEGFADPAIAMHGGVIHAKRPSGSPPRLHAFDSAEEEASFVARQIYASIANGAAPDSIAVLARTNLLLPQYQAALSARGIHNHVAGTGQIVSDSALKAAISHLRELLGPRGRLQDALTHLDDLIGEYKLDGAGGGPADSLAYFRQMAVEALRNEPRMDLTSFLSWFRVRAAESASASRNGVTLTTLHRAKGLEWDIVYLVAMEQGVLPHAKSTQPAAMEEEKRLFYVGITRARNHLYLTLARKRGKTERPASSFLSGLGAMIQDGIPQRASTRRALEYIRAGKNRLTTAEPTPLETDPALETLKLWRRRRADDLSTDEESLLPDRAVSYLASNLPADHDDLAACPGISQQFLAEHADALLKLLKALARARKARLPL